MGWFKVDDAFPDHPKFLEAGPLAGYLNLCAIAWCNRNRTDGFIPAAQVRRLASFEGIAEAFVDETVTDEVDARELARELVRVGLWEDVPRGFLIHDYLDHQNSAAEIAGLSTSRSEAGRKGAQARWGTSEKGPDGKNGVCHPNGKTDGPAMATAMANGMADASQLAIADGKNGKRDGKSMPEVRSKKYPLIVPQGAIPSADFEEWAASYESTTGHKLSARTTKAFKTVVESYEARRTEGHTRQDLLAAIVGAHSDPYRRENGYDVAESILRPTKVGQLVAKGKLRAGARPVSSVELAERLRREPA